MTEPFKQRPDIHKLYAAHTVFNRWSAADEVACTVAFLASDAASYVSGSTMCSSMAGGPRSMGRRRA
jgi:NAD(P)-dependent dehydrogenase (short-subunit alcohol dehydrogenase family)